MGLVLEGIRVLDLSRVIAGPFCSQILADFGAEVIKVEDPNLGDPGRWNSNDASKKSALFYTVNRNKKSITLDLKKEEGKRIFKNMARESDVVIDQFRPGVMDQLGLGYKELSSINKGIIYCALSGYGSTGPMARLAGHDLNFQSIAGITGCTGVPHITGIETAALAGGALYAALGIVLALYNREITGKGQMCDVSMVDGSISLLAYALSEWSQSRRLPYRNTGYYAFYNIYRTKDNRYISLAAVETKFWQEFCDKLELTQYIEFQRDLSLQGEIKAAIQAKFLEKTRDQWMEFFQGSDICITPVLSLEEMYNHPQVIYREMITRVTDYDSGQELTLAGIPIKLSATPGKMKLTFPKLGEHNTEILLSLGYNLEDIEKLKRNKVI